MAKPNNTPKVISKKHIARLERERRQVKLIRAIAVAGILIVAGLLIYGYLKLNVLQLREPVAEVNGVKITTKDWQEHVRFQRVQMLNVYNQYSFYQQNFGVDYSQQMQQIVSNLASPEVIGQQALDQMIDDILIKEEAEKRGITVSAEEVEKSIQGNFGFYPNGTPTPTVTPTEVTLPTLSSQQLTLYPSTSTPTEAPTSTVTATAMLDLSATPAASSTPAIDTPTPVPQPPTATATPFTEAGFKKDYDDTIKNFKTENISEKTIRSVYEGQLLRQKLSDEITKDTPRTEEQVWARHILVETEAEANTVYELLKKGEDYATVAKEHSKDTGSGANGGDLDWFGKGAMVAEFETAAFSQKVGEIGKPIKSQFGYHIIQVLGHEDRPLTAAQYEQKKTTEFSKWVTDTRAKADVKTFDVWKERVPTEPNLQAPAQ
ncbi:MAG TPA: peptidylprolyl isomerase [Anaerolineales bacterium]|nr:peptidylprolyl isomerase [Anaerolineales bacterium]